jgi:phospholipase C
LPSLAHKCSVIFSSGLCGHAPLGIYQDRCGYGPRLPFLAISPYAKPNFVDHKITDQTSIIRFIEDNWGLGRIGNQSFDAKAGSLMSMLDFTTAGQRAQKLFLNPSTGLRGMSEMDSSMFKPSHISVYFKVKDAD